MGKKKKNYQVSKNNAGKKYNGSKESKQKAVAKQNTSRPKSQLLDEPIKDDVKVVVGAAEAKEPNRIEELKSQIEKLQAEKQAYYEGAENGESEVVAAERKDTNSIDRTKIDVEIYRLQKELRELLYKEAEANKAQEAKENKPEGKENKPEGKENKPEEKKNEEVESPEVKALKSQISDLENKISSEEWVLRTNEGNYLPGDLEQIKAGIDKLKAQRDELNRKLNDLKTGKEPEQDPTKSNDTKDGKGQEPPKGNEGKDGKGQEPPKGNGEKDGEGQEPPKKDGDNKDAKQDSPEVKALKDKIKELEGKINAESNALMNKGGNYLESDIKDIKARLDELKAEHAELIGKLNDLEKGLKGLGGKDTPEAGTNKDDKGKDSNKDQSDDKGKNKDGKDQETVTYRIGPFKRFLMSVIRKIKSWAKADGRIAKICDSLEGTVIGSATPLIDGASNEKEAKKALDLGKVKDYEKEVADAKNAEYSKDKYEQANDHVEAKAKLDLADMEYIKDVIMKAWDNKETNLMTEVFNKQYKEGFKGKDGINEEELKKFIEENNIPSVTKTARINAALWRTSQKIVEMAKEKGFVVNQGKGKNANAKPLSEIYPSLEARVKTDRVSEEYSKKDEQTKETSKERKADNDKSEKDSKVIKADDDLDK